MTDIAVIVDIVRSRELSDRAAGQDAVEAAFRSADETHPARVSLWATVGDEFQVVYGDLGMAIAATGLARLMLPVEVDVRFGIGAGRMRRVDDDRPTIFDGSAWWNAREAIDVAHRRQSAGDPSVAAWFCDDQDSGRSAAVNALLLLRDHVIARMKARERRVAASALRGERQADIARAEGITQSAVSQSLHRSGAGAMLEAQRLLIGAL